MAIKKSDLFSSLWASRDALRGGLDARQELYQYLCTTAVKLRAKQSSSKKN